jgi:hypothetical protein
LGFGRRPRQDPVLPAWMGPRVHSPDRREAAADRRVPCAMDGEAASDSPRVFLVVPIGRRFFLAATTPPLCRVGWYIPFWLTLVRWDEHLGLACAVGMASPLMLRFLAETAKADLEKSAVRRPYAESLSHRPWRRLWSEAAGYSCILFLGLWLLWPRRSSALTPARTIPAFLPTGLALATIGGIMIVAKLWQMRAKVRF